MEVFAAIFSGGDVLSTHAAESESESTLPVLCWHDWWPEVRHGVVRQPSTGWSGRMWPGLITLLDTDGEQARAWLPLWAGEQPPLRGTLQLHQLPAACRQLAQDVPLPCGPRVPLPAVWWWPHDKAAQDTQCTADMWSQAVAAQWPQWDAQVWHQHVEGFALTSHLHKPLWHLSTGTWRKLQLSAALASGAALTLIDAPLAGLDAASIRYLQGALHALGALMRQPNTPQRWVVVAHWEAMPAVQWDLVLELPDAMG